MSIIGDAHRQAFMPKHEYQSLREEGRAWSKIHRQLVMVLVTFLGTVVVVCAIISLKIVFPSDNGNRPFCSEMRVQPLPMNLKRGDSDLFPGAFYLTDQETVDYYWMVVFMPSVIIFLISSLYLVAGIAVAYSAPSRHGCLKVVENNFCASRRDAFWQILIPFWIFSSVRKVNPIKLSARSFPRGVRCLGILNVIFAVIFGVLALFLGSSLLTLGSSCSVPLFWCYEIATWGLVSLYGGAAFFLRRKAAVILDEGEFGGRSVGVEMLEASPLEVTPDVERRVHEGFKAWMGPSLLSSDDEDEHEHEHESYQEVPYLTHSATNRQRVLSVDL